MQVPNSDDVTKPDTDFFEEILKQISTQAALIAGFTFIVIREIPFSEETYNRSFALLLFAVATVCLELLAVFITGTLAFVIKADDSLDIEEIYETEVTFAYFANWLGILLFLATIFMLVWVKYPTTSFWAGFIIFLVFVIAVLLFIRITRKNKYYVEDSVQKSKVQGNKQ